jgi:hypothetical protein
LPIKKPFNTLEIEISVGHPGVNSPMSPLVQNDPTVGPAPRSAMPVDPIYRRNRDGIWFRAIGDLNAAANDVAEKQKAVPKRFRAGTALIPS